MNYQHPERCVFIGNIPYRATEEQVREIMESFGPIASLELKKDPSNGLNTGIGFCEFCDMQTAEQAKKMNNKKVIDGRQIRIDNPDGGKKGNTSSLNRSYCSYLTQDDAYRLLVQTKNMIRENPEHAKEILTNHPSIAKAIEELMTINHLM